MGRPLADINEAELVRLASGGAKNTELANYFGVDENTIVNRFAKILTKIRSVRRMHLRTAQTDKALGGDVTMLIWLGKNDLDQTDRVEQQHSGGVTIKVEYEDVDYNKNAVVREQESLTHGQQQMYEPQSRPSPLL